MQKVLSDTEALYQKAPLKDFDLWIFESIWIICPWSSSSFVLD